MNSKTSGIPALGDDPERGVSGPTTAGSTPNRTVVVWLAAGFIGLSLIVKFMTGGWGIILFGIPYLAVCAIHFGVHRFAGGRLALSVTNLLALISSNLVLLFAFLLQEDGGDGPSWITITALLRGGPGSESAIPPSWAGSLTVLVAIPLLASWLALLAISMPIGRQKTIRIGGLAALGGLIALLFGLVAAIVASPAGKY